MHAVYGVFHVNSNAVQILLRRYNICEYDLVLYMLPYCINFCCRFWAIFNDINGSIDWWLLHLYWSDYIEKILIVLIYNYLNYFASTLFSFMLKTGDFNFPLSPMTSLHLFVGCHTANSGTGFYSWWFDRRSLNESKLGTTFSNHLFLSVPRSSYQGSQN